MHPEAFERLTRGRLPQQGTKRRHALPVRARPRDDEIVLLRLNGQKPQPGVAADDVQRHSPVRPPLQHGGCDGIVVSRLYGIAGGFALASKRSINTRVPLPWLRLIMTQPVSASAAEIASLAERPSKRKSPRRKTMPCRRP